MMGQSKNVEKKKLPISYWSKEKCSCPICQKHFEREIMRSGNGRMIAGGLTEELHRIFEPSAKYGRVYPLIYEIGVCPNCYSAFFWNDFTEKIAPEDGDKLYEHSDKRKCACEEIFPYFNLKHERTLYDGTAMYYLALMTYDDMGAYALPTMKKAILSLRLAWLTQDINERCSGHNYDIVSKMFYSKALFFYQQAVINEEKRLEKSSTLPNMGPDIDKNYGWDGVIYLCGLLEYKYGQTNDIQLRLKKLSESKTAIARIFGLGKSSKNKPGPLLEHARDLYDNLSKLVNDDNF
ncbi:DUF2225 domain-containing protein [Treponema sp. Marseille-Q3903]|jgi:hypothetical protein|uniref:DUF2225 domain-containing protein n=1 Tax=Treponema sp. Marseille-Q3903 TaxID=2766703 RepID=UPI0016521FCD|nr:DUF2225 domain-containing protein [Treponema sp. Marseille-Q3903]MBC6713797.1 DUF2225 domain-containing protein [Treponema sp. Marseille-Q3903]